MKIALLSFVVVKRWVELILSDQLNVPCVFKHQERGKTSSAGTTMRFIRIELSYPCSVFLTLFALLNDSDPASGNGRIKYPF
jgi:hypothetical protein